MHRKLAGGLRWGGALFCFSLALISATQLVGFFHLLRDTGYHGSAVPVLVRLIRMLNAAAWAAIILSMTQTGVSLIADRRDWRQVGISIGLYSFLALVAGVPVAIGVGVSVAAGTQVTRRPQRHADTPCD